jgi:hypothetical protein
MTGIGRYEAVSLGELLIHKFIDGQISDMECLAACRKLKSDYSLINKGMP